ncbi:LysM peptidoglycan-binding domain-containing protein [Lachnospiraceae bacterium LCP25S3_G4]
MNKEDIGYIMGKEERENRVFHEKLLITISILLLIVIFNILLNGFSSSAHDINMVQESDYIYYKSIELNEGDTLWSIAEKYTNGEYHSILNYIADLKEINNLKNDDIKAGQLLTVAYNNVQ